MPTPLSINKKNDILKFIKMWNFEKFSYRREENISNHASDKECVSQLYKELSKLSSKAGGMAQWLEDTLSVDKALDSILITKNIAIKILH
jgi:hypothetical protein